MVAPYSPPLLTTPIVNPSVGGFVKPVPYLSVSQYQYAPTAMDTESLEPFGTAADQTQVLADTINRASGWADRIAFGASPSGKGASLCASQSVETAYVRRLNGEFRLLCSYKPVLEIDGVALGTNPADVAGIDGDTAIQIRIIGRTLFVPGWMNVPFGNSVASFGPRLSGPQNRVYAVWSYVAGYPHLMLAATASAGDTVIVVEPNGPGDTLLGVYPGSSLSIDDVGQSEDIVVLSVAGTTITLSSPLVNTHTLPDAPDFVPVTALPADVIQAVIFLTTALIKSRGDNSIVLDEITEPKATQSAPDGVLQDVKDAFAKLAPFSVTLQSPELSMTAAAVRSALHKYLVDGVTSGAIPSVSNVNKYQKKITPETELYEEQAPGSPDGAVIFMYFPTKNGRRIALGGYTSGRKARLYQLDLICFFRWKGRATEDGDEANEEFQDGLTAWIEASRQAGTQAVELGGDGSGTIFAWGEGPNAGDASGGDDLNWRTGMPRTIRGQTSQIFSVLSIHVIEIVAT